MKKELEIELLKLIQDSKEVIPEVLQQTLTWGLIDNVFGIVFGVVFTVAAYLIHKKYKGKYLDCETPFPMMIVMFGVALGPILMLCCSMTVVKILVAPSVYLLQRVAG